MSLNIIQEEIRISEIKKNNGKIKNLPIYKHFKFILSISIGIIILLIIISLLNLNYMRISDILPMIFVIIMPIFPIIIGYFILKRKIKMILHFKKFQNDSININDLKKYSKIDPIGALYIFFCKIDTLNEEIITDFDRNFDNKRLKKKLFKLYLYFKANNDIKRAGLAMFFAGNINTTIEIYLDYDLIPELKIIIKFSEFIPIRLIKKIFTKFVQSGDLEGIFEIIKIRKFTPKLLDNFSYVLLDHYFKRINAPDDYLFSFQFEKFMKILDEEYSKKNNEFKRSLENLKEIISIIHNNEQDTNDLICLILDLLLKNKSYLLNVGIQNFFESILKSVGGFNSEFTSFYSLIKFKFINNNYEKIPRVYKNFKEFEYNIGRSLTEEIRNIINKNLELEDSSEFKNINISEDLINDLLKYFSYSGFDFFNEVLINLLIDLNLSNMDTNLIFHLRAFYLKMANSYWNNILKNIYLEKIEFKFLKNWNEDIKIEYKKYIIEQIAILRCKIFYKSVDFKIFSRDDAYFKVIEILNNIGIAFKNMDDRFSIDNIFLKKILIASGWGQVYSLKKSAFKGV